MDSNNKKDKKDKKEKKAKNEKKEKKEPKGEIVDGIRLGTDELRMLFDLRSSKAAALSKIPEEAEPWTVPSSVACHTDAAGKLRAEREAEYDVAQEILKEKRNSKSALAGDYEELAGLAELLGNNSTAIKLRAQGKGLRDRGRV